ncbi:hypothetical protein KR222_007237, partial [Zaprionus bogoriensis]
MWFVYLVFLLWSSAECTGNYLIEEVVRESHTDLLLIRPDYCQDGLLHQILMTPPVPVVLRSLNTIGISQAFSNQLHVVCLPKNKSLTEQQLTKLMRSIRTERSIFLVDGTGEDSRQCMRSLLEQCYKWKVLHVIVVLLSEVKEGNVYYRYIPYPQFAVEEHPPGHRPFFAYFNRFPDMHRQPLIVLPDQKNPRSIVYKDWRTGSQILAGSVGRFVNTLAWKLNATVEYPYELQPGPSIHANEMLALAEKLQVDIPAGMVFLEQPEQLAYMGYPFELSHICLMIPLAQPILIRDIYLTLFSVQHIILVLVMVYVMGWLIGLYKRLTEQATSLVDLILDDVALRGLLGQSIGQRLEPGTLCGCYLYLLLGFVGLNLSSIHEAALGTLLTHPPKHFQPRTFDDVKRVQLPLVVDVAYLTKDNRYLQPLPAHLQWPVNVSELDRLRDNMNQSYVFLASRIKWTLLSAQQKYFPNELFLYSMDACVSPLTLMGFQLPANSWFEPPISRLIMEVRAMGLYQHWVNMHFYDMVTAGLISFRDPIKRQQPHVGGSLRLEDLQWVGYAYVALLSLATTVFVLEVILERL